MCFNNDYDWYASSVSTQDGPASERVRCGECSKRINTGEWVRNIYMQENDEGEWIEENDGEFQSGETFEINLCRECVDILALIQEVELERGCGLMESQPHFGELYDALVEDPDYIEEIHRRRLDLIPHLSMRFPDLCRE